MAGETKGKMAEIFTYIASEALNSGNKIARFQKKPEKVFAIPDITFGESKDAPEAVFLVNSSESPKESDKKFWRNVGEIFDTKSVFGKSCLICNVVFSSNIKESLIKTMSIIADVSIYVDMEVENGGAILDWLDSLPEDLPQGDSEKIARTRQNIKESQLLDGNFSRAFENTSNTMLEACMRGGIKHNELWELINEDRKTIALKEYIQRSTFLRRGLARWSIIEDSIIEDILTSYYKGNDMASSSVPRYLIEIGVVVKSTSGYKFSPQTKNPSTIRNEMAYIADFYLELFGTYEGAISGIKNALMESTQEMIVNADFLKKSTIEFSHRHDYFLSRLQEVKDPVSLYNLILLCHDDTSMNREVNLEETVRVWLYDHIIAVLRSSSKADNNFGYGTLMKHFQNVKHQPQFINFCNQILSSMAGKQLIAAKRWLSRSLENDSEPGRRGFQDWLSGKKNINPIIIACFTYSIAYYVNIAKNIETQDRSDIINSYLYGYWNKILTHQDFEPLPSLVMSSFEGKANRILVDTLLSDLSDEEQKTSGKIEVYEFGGKYVYWKSAYGSHVNDKTKELMGRAYALKYGFHEDRYYKRDLELILIVDGDFKEHHLKALNSSGWDFIIYPDEISTLAAKLQL